MATVTDRKGALQALGRCKPSLVQIKCVLCDIGDVGKPFTQKVREIAGEDATV